MSTGGAGAAGASGMGTGFGSSVGPEYMPASTAGGAGAGGFDIMKMMPMMGAMGQQQMNRAQQPIQQPIPPQMMPMIPQGTPRNVAPPQFPEAGPTVPAQRGSPVQSLMGAAIQNMDPMSFNALIQGFTKGVRR